MIKHTIYKDDFINQQRQHHAENPVAFFKEILQNIWADRDEDQIAREWKRLCSSVRWYAEDVLVCMDSIVTNPPADLAELMQNEGWIMLDHGAASYTVIRI
jgi:hypothetical protein